jgi:hypothetical protein
MSALTAYLQPILANDSTVASQCSNRVFAFDIRKSGPNAYGPDSAIPVVSDVGFQLCTICIDDIGSIAPALSPLGATQDRVAVWIFDEWSAAGRSRIDLLADRVRVLLHLYQEPTTRALLTWTGRLGIQPDPPPATAAIDQVTFNAIYVPIGIRT